MAGKGSKQRPTDPKKFGPNYERIPNFGFRPKWMKELDKKRRKT